MIDGLISQALRSGMTDQQRREYAISSLAGAGLYNREAVSANPFLYYNPQANTKQQASPSKSKLLLLCN